MMLNKDLQTRIVKYITMNCKSRFILLSLPESVNYDRIFNEDLTTFNVL